VKEEQHKCDKTGACERRQSDGDVQRTVPETPGNGEQEAGGQSRPLALQPWQGESAPAELLARGRNEASDQGRDREGKGDRRETEQRRDAKGDEPEHGRKEQDDRVPDEGHPDPSQASEHVLQAGFATVESRQQDAQQARHEVPEGGKDEKSH
jgi:hypothetical protein